MFRVIVVTLEMTLLMHKCTSIVIPNLLLVWYNIVHPNISMMKYCHELWKFGLKNNCKSTNTFCLQGMTNNVRFAFSVGDTTRTVSNWYRARQLELVTLYIMQY